MAATETIGTVVAGEISETKSLLLKFALYMKKQGQAESTILTRGRQMAILVKRGANILDQESVKEVIADQKWVNKRKQNAVDTYSCFLKMLGQTWYPPHYRVEQKIPFIPTEEELDTLIDNSGPKISTYLQLLKETAIRAGEANQLKWTEVDFERNVVRITPEKGSRPRIFSVSSKLMNKFAALRKRTMPSDPNRVFSKLLRTTRRLYMVKRKRLAALYNNPRLIQIHFHTFRHWKATTLYHQTKDLLYVQRFLGHRSISNTMLYIQIDEALFGGEPDGWVCKVANTVEEAIPLLEQGFTEASDFNGVKIYRKAKSLVNTAH